MAIGLACLTAACSSGDAAAEARDITVRDSAGVAIVENGRVPSQPAFVLDTTPAIDIGDGGDDDPDYQLYQVTSAVRRADGSILIASRGSGDLRVYGTDGRFVRSIGRKGSGPGEFEQLSWVTLAGSDTILTYDFSGRRLSTFSPSGEYITDAVLGGANTGAFLSPIGILGDGRIVATGRGSTPENSSGLSRDSVLVVLVGREGAIGDTVVQAIGGERSVKRTESGANRTITSVPPPYGRNTSYGVQGDAIAVATADAYEIRVYDVSGALRRIVRRRVDPVPVTDDDVAVLIERNMSGDMPPQIRNVLEQQFRELPVPAVMPPYSLVFLDRAERLWVREAAPARGPARWAVYDRQGELAAQIEVPERFRITEAGGDDVLGIMRDEDDLERVQLFRLRVGEE